MISLILSGGMGSRLWPLSRKLLPKQFLKLFDNHSLFQLTLQRNLPFSSSFIISSNESHYFLALDQIDELKENNKNTLLDNKQFSFILESQPKNTAAAIAFACFDAGEDEIIFVCPSDHIIDNNEEYLKTVEKAYNIAQDGCIVTFGIKPSHPETGYGYIQAKLKDGKSDIMDVELFHEKPDLKTATRYLEENQKFPSKASTFFFWNSGMFMFKAKVLLNQLKEFSPQVYDSSLKAFEKTKKDNGVIRITQMDDIPSISIDYAVMEKSKNIKVMPSSFQWNDLGSFDALADKLKSHQFTEEINSSNNFYISQNSNKHIASVGVEDLIVVDTKEALLISKKGKSQYVKDLVKSIEKSHPILVEEPSVIHRPWGSYEVLVESRFYKIKRIIVKPQKRLSLQKHYHRNEHWIVVSGTALVEVEGKEFLLRTNESTYIKAGYKHRLSNPGKIPVILIEAQVGEYTGEDDIIRLEDDFKRSSV